MQGRDSLLPLEGWCPICHHESYALLREEVSSVPRTGWHEPQGLTSEPHRAGVRGCMGSKERRSSMGGGEGVSLPGLGKSLSPSRTLVSL